MDGLKGPAAPQFIYGPFLLTEDEAYLRRNSSSHQETQSSNILRKGSTYLRGKEIKTEQIIQLLQAACATFWGVG